MFGSAGSHKTQISHFSPKYENPYKTGNRKLSEAERIMAEGIIKQRLAAVWDPEEDKGADADMFMLDYTKARRANAPINVVAFAQAITNCRDEYMTAATKSRDDKMAEAAGEEPDLGAEFGDVPLMKQELEELLIRLGIYELGSEDSDLLLNVLANVAASLSEMSEAEAEGTLGAAGFRNLFGFLSDYRNYYDGQIEDGVIFGADAIADLNTLRARLDLLGQRMPDVANRERSGQSAESLA